MITKYVHTLLDSSPRITVQSAYRMAVESGIEQSGGVVPGYYRSAVAFEDYVTGAQETTAIPVLSSQVGGHVSEAAAKVQLAADVNDKLTELESQVSTADFWVFLGPLETHLDSGVWSAQVTYHVFQGIPLQMPLVGSASNTVSFP